jgi:16S rRNA G527 N7-methylase RsmG
MEDEDEDRKIFKLLEAQLDALLLEVNRKRPPFIPDFPTHLEEKRITTFKKEKPENADKFWERIENISCRSMALNHDFYKLIEHFNKHKFTVPKLLSYLE